MVTMKQTAAIGDHLLCALQHYCYRRSEGKIISMGRERSQQIVHAKQSDRHRPPGILHVVAMPIGHPEDITIRALRILRSIDIVASEDPAATQSLLRYHRIQARLTSYGPTGIKEKAAILIDQLLQGAHIALVSDCGSPVIADPGFVLIHSAHTHGIQVKAVPGPSAVTAAMSVAGLSADSFFFQGRLPSSGTALERCLRRLLRFAEPTVSLLVTSSLSHVLSHLAKQAPRRVIILACDLTKREEIILRGTPRQVQKMLMTVPPVSEITLIVKGSRRVATG
jgi:16S rRNA (cytidine1402-2'-O)-methyltransferase